MAASRPISPTSFELAKLEQTRSSLFRADPDYKAAYDANAAKLEGLQSKIMQLITDAARTSTIAISALLKGSGSIYIISPRTDSPFTLKNGSEPVDPLTDEEIREGLSFIERQVQLTLRTRTLTTRGILFLPSSENISLELVISSYISERKGQVNLVFKRD